ncbi:hypothetical protein B0T14DRAFT_599242 [Immersiella caudata]|uniref:Zn(2)-C6 fungal-type domain-containing protein n=1 Tax=Immersiella caudata TaxID=314043 RepID=A0AA39XJD1_9PEZI|nr:hypothetical protein B0T14DRAFT_599242 [Immersiella caudata]
MSLVPKPLAPKPSDVSGIQRSIPLKRTRASKPKVRTGCRTCKIRRVKCDEAKPICQQCHKARIACDGYEIQSLQSKTKNVIAPFSPEPRSAPLLRRFSNQDVPFFDFFRHALTDDFTGYGCTDFWSRIVLCEAMTSDCVFHAVLAISSLSSGISESESFPTKGQQRNKPSALFPWTARSVVNSKHRIAMQHYLKALSLFRKQVEKKANIQSPRAVVIMTLLLITFELLQGNMDGVDALITSSINLLRPSLTQIRKDALMPTETSQPLPKEDDIADIGHILPFLSITGAWTPFLPTQSVNLALWDTTPSPNIRSLNLHDPTQLQTEWSRFFSLAIAFTAQAFTTLSQSETIPPSLVNQQQTYLSLLASWKTILTTAFSLTAPHSNPHASLRVMQLHHLTLTVAIQCCLDTTDTAWDDYDSQFQTILDETLSLVAHPPPGLKKTRKYHAAFTLTFGPLSTLGPVIAKCRNHHIRMRALEAARRMPWREGSWDAEAELYGKLGAVLLEEKARVKSGDERAPKGERWNWVEGRRVSGGDGNEEKMLGVYVRNERGKDGEAVVERIELGLGRWVDVCGEVGCGEDHGVGLEGLE